MAKRKSTGKRQRFEIFKRDGFKCRYCGATPVQKVLRVDHVIPVAEGGPDEPANLVTACFDCNAGKAAVPLEKKKFESDLPSEKQREHVEQLREFLALQKEIDAARDDVAAGVEAQWVNHVGPISQEMASRLRGLVRGLPLEKLVEAIEITGRRVGAPGREYEYRYALEQQKYFSGVLRRWREEASAPPPPPPPPQTKVSARARGVQERLVVIVSAGTHNTIRTVLGAFAVLAYGRPGDFGQDYDPEYPDSCVRGLVLRTRPSGGGNINWWIEDDQEWNRDDDLGGGVEFMCADHDLSLALRDGDLNAARIAYRQMALVQQEARGFCAYLKGEPGAEDYLRARRDELDWHNPRAA